MNSPPQTLVKTFSPNIEQATLTCSTSQKHNFDENRTWGKDESQPLFFTLFIFYYFTSEFYIIVLT